MGPRIDRTNLKMTKTRATKQVFFDVDIKGEPAPKVKWYFKGEEVSIESVLKYADAVIFTI